MNYRLVVNPGTPQAWEILLKPGVHRIGRNDDNDFTIGHASVSGTHCEITVSDNQVLLKDLGSTNGTFVNRSRVSEAILQSGQHVQFGVVDLTFESTVPTAVSPTAAATPPIPIPIPVPVPVPGGNRPPAFIPPPVRSSTPILTAQAPDELTDENATALPPAEPSPTLAAGNAVCKSHPKTPARFLCNRCHKYFCDLCVTTRGPGKFCRSCGQALTPLHVPVARPVAEKGFFARLPEAAIYPFKGSGALILAVAAIIFALFDAVAGGWLFIFYFVLGFVAIGYLFSFMQNIIHATAAGEDEMPDLPGFDGVFAACFRFIGLSLLCYGPPIALELANLWGAEISGGIILAAKILCNLYFPMALLAVAMKDNVLAANPLVVVPAILKVPGEYLVAAILLTAIFALRELGDEYSKHMGSVAFSTRRMDRLFTSFGVRALWSFASIYLLVVNMRILGLLYLTKKHRLGWFAR